MVIPNSNIRIIKCPLELDNLNQITFATKAAQETYFKSLPYIEIDDASYQRKDGYIRFPASFDTTLPYNYVMYQNESYSNKWFYAFITNKEYLNDEVTAIYIETDTFQTWQFDLVYKPSFIEREMIASADDLVGANIVPEQLETGDYVINAAIKKNSLTYRGFVVAATIDLEGTITHDKYPNVAGGSYGGVYSGAKLFYYGLESDINTKLKDVADKGQSDGILAIFAVPMTMIETTGGHVVNTSATVVSQDWTYIIPGGDSDNTPTRPTTVDGYTPKNNKLFVYPYSYLLASNNSGSNAIYKYELFSNETNDFKLYGAITPGMSIILVPKNYNKVSENFEETLPLGKFPIANYNDDVYKNWIRQQGLNIGISAAGSLLSTATGVVTGNPIGVASGILGVANTLGQVYEHSLIPPHNNGNLNIGDVMYGSGNLTFTLYQMSVKSEMAEIIDNFFSMYGYKTNKVKIPNLYNRSNWNFVKTINCNLEGEIPQKDLQSIKDMFNNGITLWHTTGGFLDYSQTNS